MKYILLNISFSILVTVLMLSFLFFKLKYIKISPKVLLILAYVLSSIILIQPIVVELLPKKDFSNPYIQIWSSANNNDFSKHEKENTEQSIISINDKMFKTENFDLNSISSIIILFSLFGFCFTAIKTTLSFLRLNKIIQNSFVIKKYKKVEIIVSDSVKIPFSVRTFKKALVVIPNSFITNPSLYKIAVLHELQHHKNKDTIVVYFLLLIKSTFFWNPFIHIFSNIVTSLQEFACDEALIYHGRVTSMAYTQSLYKVALNNFDKQSMLAGTTGMGSFTSQNILIRRIKFMSSYKNTRYKKIPIIFFSSFLFIITFGSVFASQNIINDRRISMKEAQKLFQNAKDNSTFPLVLNEAVYDQLNVFLGTPDGRNWVKQSITKMEKYKNSINERIKYYNLPNELMAIPLVESGFNNTPASNKTKSAGLWMFMPGTARHYNLKVENGIDERLNTDLETDAGLRYLSANNLRFQDWGLAILAYNVGESGVQKAIEKVGTRDPWKLIKNGFENDHNYLAKVYAAIIILKNPEIVNN